MRRRGSRSSAAGRASARSARGSPVDYLAGHPEHADVGVRFDTAAILVIGPDRALIRHHINCMGASEPMRPDDALPEIA